MSADNTFAYSVLRRDSAARWRTTQSDALKPKNSSRQAKAQKVAELILLNPFSVVFHVKCLEKPLKKVCFLCFIPSGSLVPRRKSQ